MAKGLSVPLKTSKGGGASKEKEETQLDKLVVLAVQEGGDKNPFQDLGIRSKILYRINDDASKFDIKEEIKRVLESFKGRLALSDNGVVIRESENTPQGEEGEMHVSFEYLNLEINELREFLAPFTELGDK